MLSPGPGPVGGAPAGAAPPQPAGVSAELLRRMLEAVRDYALFTLDPRGHVASWNVGAERLKGYTAQEIIGQHFSVFYSEEDRRRGHPEEELRVAKADGRYEEDGWRYRKDGSRFWANVVITAVFDPSGQHIGFAKVTRDITERRLQEETLRQTEERFRLLVESVRDYAIFMLDPTGHIASWNSGAERLKGYTAKEVIGQHFSIFYPEEARLRGHPDTELRIALEIGHYEEEGWRLQRDGSQIWAYVAITPIRDSKGNHIGFAKVTRDLTERRALEADRERMMARLRESNQELQEFAVVASHDLQEPLRKIQLFAQQLRECHTDSMSEEGRDYLNRMQRAAERGRALVQGLLAFSRVTTRAQPPIPVSLEETAGEAVQDLGALIESVHGQVVIGALPTIEADAVQMRQLLQNLIGNALKFHREGVPPVIELSAEQVTIGPTEPGQPGWQISVADNGIGFDEKYLDRIFKLFQRLHDRGSFDGSGIGLAVCRKIVTRHGGTITARSTPGVGSQFFIVLPEKFRHAAEET